MSSWINSGVIQVNNRPPDLNLIGLSGIVVGPIAAALFISAWQILTEQRNASRELLTPSGDVTTE